MSNIKSWITTEEPLKKLNDCLLIKEWEKYADGSLGKWEMDSLSYYYNDHELSGVNFAKYDIADFINCQKSRLKVNLINGEENSL